MRYINSGYSDWPLVGAVAVEASEGNLIMGPNAVMAMFSLTDGE